MSDFFYAPRASRYHGPSNSAHQTCVNTLSAAPHPNLPLRLPFALASVGDTGTGKWQAQGQIGVSAGVSAVGRTACEKRRVSSGFRGVGRKRLK